MFAPSATANTAATSPARALHSAAKSDTAPAITSAKTKSGSVRWKRFRSVGLTMVPNKLPATLAAATAPKNHSGSASRFRPNATRNTRKPVAPRSTPIAAAAARHRRESEFDAFDFRFRERLRGVGRDTHCEVGRGEVQQRRDPQHLRRVGRVEDPDRDGAAEQAGNGCEAGEARVRGDEIAVVGDEAWDERALRHRICLVEHQEREDLRVEQEVLDVTRDEEAQDPTPEQGGGRDHTFGTREAVDERSHDRREQHKREEGDQEVRDHRVAAPRPPTR